MKRSMPWDDEEPADGLWRKTATQVATLFGLAVIGGVGGAALAAYVLHQPVETPVVAQPAQETAPAPDAAPQAVARITRPAEPVEAAAPLSEADAVRFAADAAPAELGQPDLLQPAVLDTGSTAAIPVSVAETEEEVAALEQAMARDGVDGFALSDETPAEETPPAPPVAVAVAAVDAGPLSPAFVTEHVNLRDGPDNDAGVVAVIPADTEVLAEADCAHWCAVEHDGRRGYVYKSFIRRTP